MWKGRWLAVAVVVGLTVLAAAAGGGSDDRVRRAAMTGERNGLHLRVQLIQAHGVIAAETQIENRRRRPAFLVPDQCGRVTEALLVRTRFQPEGRTWSRSLHALKRFVLDQQQSSQGPERLAPRRPGEGSRAVPNCERPRRIVKLAAGATIRERWEVDPYSTPTLDVMGARNTKVRVEVVEARSPDDIEFLDILPEGQADAARAGRKLRLETRASAVLDHPPAASGPRFSPGQLYDLLLAHRGLRSWLASQPAASWRSARLMPQRDGIQFRAVTSRYERAVVARARADGSGVTVRLPGPADRIRTFRTRPATLPRGVRVVRGARTWRPTRDVIARRLALPSGRVTTDGFPGRQSPLIEYRVAPGAYPVYVTLARLGRHNFDSVALATLVVSDHKPVRWRRIGGIGVDGGVAAFTSMEGARALDRIMSAASTPDGYYERVFDSLTAHDHHVTEAAIDGELNQVMFSTGSGDGGYPLLVGLDAEGRPARFVLDFLLIHLAWPGRPELGSRDGI
jgi:hypothetical protein